MTREYKICNSCGEKVDLDYNFCPNCKSQSFRQTAVEVRRKTSNPSVVHKLLYWNYDGEYALAKSKLGAIFVFIFALSFAVTQPELHVGIIISAIFALIAFLFGYLIHYFRGKPNEVVLENNDYGLLTDVSNLLFRWQNKRTGEYVLSKTKIISEVVFVLFMILDTGVQGFDLYSMLVVAVVFTAPVFAVGYVIHRLTNPYPTNHSNHIQSEKPKEVKKQEELESTAPAVEKTLIPQFENYKAKVNQLRAEFDAKDDVARELIEKRFQPPQMTYTRFISLVDKSKKMFDREADSALTILNLATEDSPRVDTEIKLKIHIMKSIISKIDDLTNELVLTMDSSDDGDVDALIDDMEEGIGSLKNYK